MGLIIILPFIYQSYSIPFNEWVPLLTVSLAPLIAHIAAGAPYPSLLTDDSKTSRPSWHDTICLYNPTSILWRYAAIADRRLRAREWSSIDLAATNALFWIGPDVHAGSSQGYMDRDKDGKRKGRWDGSEEMVVLSRPYCTSLPPGAHTELLSWDTIKTLIVLLQGLSAAYTLLMMVGVVTGYSNMRGGLDSIFFPIALFGVLRLFAAGWLTSEFSYMARETASMTFPIARDGPPSTTAHPKQEQHHGGYFPLPTQIFEIDSARLGTEPRHFRPTSYLPSRIFRCVYMFFLLVVLAAALFSSFPMFGESIGFSVTTFMMAFFYVFMITVTCGITLFYFFKGKTTHTIIPCIGSVWYKIYTIIVFAWMAAVFVVACLETTRTPQGFYTTLTMVS